MIRILLVFLLLSVPVGADACSCIPSGPPQQELAQSDVVFVGIVRSQDGPHRIPAGRDTYRYSDVVFRFVVVAAWKGIDSREVEVRTGSGGGDCGYVFTVGEPYLVYAHQAPSGALGTGLCSRTGTLSGAEVDLAAFGPPSVDRRRNRNSWDEVFAPSRCPRHPMLLLRRNTDEPVDGLSVHAVAEFAVITRDRFPYAGLRIEPVQRTPSGARVRTPGPALVCPACRQGALDWAHARGASCLDREPARATHRRAGPPPSEAEYRRRYPERNFAFRFDDGRSIRFDSIDERFERRLGTVADTAIAVRLGPAAMHALYERMIELRAFDLDEPHPGYPRKGGRRDAGECDRASLYVRADTVVRMYSWRVRSSPATPIRAGDGWRRLDDAVRAIVAAIRATPEVRGLPTSSFNRPASPAPEGESSANLLYGKWTTRIVSQCKP